MKYTVVILALLVAVGTVFADQFTAAKNLAGPKESQGQESNPVTTRVGGETIATATPISVPYSDIASTAGAINNYDEICPFSGSTAPDVVYALTVPYNMNVQVELCNSYYDTKVYVYVNGYTPGAPLVCNDDACSGPNYPYAWLSKIAFDATVGNTYYIVVDGYGSSSGTYIMNVTENIPCTYICPPNGCPEGEPVCGDNYVDHYNGGCNSTPYVFQPVCPPSGSSTAVLCGESGTYYYYGYSYRDTDWFPVWAVGGTVTMKCCASFPLQLLQLYTVNQVTCSYGGYQYVQVGAGEEAVLTYSAYAGEEMWVWVGPTLFGSGVPCGSDYVLTVEGVQQHPSCTYTATEETSWGAIKKLYR
jgi:hypothetical protein